MNPLTIKTIDNRKLKSYELKLGDWYSTDFGDGKITGIQIIKSNVSSFEFDKGEIRHMIQVELETGETVNQEFDRSSFSLKEKIFNQIQIDRIGILKAIAWKIADRKTLENYIPSI